MRFRVDEISSVIGEEIQQYRQSVDLTETGKGLEVALHAQQGRRTRDVAQPLRVLLVEERDRAPPSGV